jgi:hypothetical protein
LRMLPFIAWGWGSTILAIVTSTKNPRRKAGSRAGWQKIVCGLVLLFSSSGIFSKRQENGVSSRKYKKFQCLHKEVFVLVRRVGRRQAPTSWRKRRSTLGD